MPTRPKKTRGIVAVIERFQHQWRARYTDINGAMAYVAVSDSEAWDSDIENGLPVILKLLPGNGCKILSRKGNKRFIKIGS
jgi:hypothetical protein